MVKRLVRVVVVLVVLLVAVDFGAKLLVENLAARALSSRRGVNGPVDVSFGGFPFLWSLKDKSFGRVTVEAEDVRSGGFASASGVGPASEAKMDSVRLELEDVTVRGDVWRDGEGGSVSATNGRGSATLGQGALNRLVPSEYSARLALRDGSIRVTVSSTFGEQEAEVAEDQVRLEPGDGAGTLVIDAPSPVGPITIPLPALVDGVVFEDLDLKRGELELTFSVEDVKLEL